MALNKWIGMGRICNDLELKQTTTGKVVVSFKIAIDRGTKDKKETDFISIVAWENNASFISRYFAKGNLICIEGRLQTRSYTAQDGSTRNVTEVVVESANFTGEKSNAVTDQNPAFAAPSAPKFEEVSNDDDLPF